MKDNPVTTAAVGLATAAIVAPVAGSLVAAGLAVKNIFGRKAPIAGTGGIGATPGGTPPIAPAGAPAAAVPHAGAIAATPAGHAPAPSSMATRAAMAAPAAPGFVSPWATPAAVAPTAAVHEPSLMKRAFNAITPRSLWGKIALGTASVAAVTIGGMGIARAEAEDAEPSRAPVTQANAEEGLLDQSINFAKGLYKDANPSNWSLKGGVNLAHAAGHGVVNGTAWLGSFAYANTVGWFTDQSTDEVHKDYVGKAVNTAFEKTIGMPDLSGHWAQAVHGVAELGMPAKAVSVGVLKLARAFNLTEKASLAVKGANFTAPLAIGGPTPVMP